MVRHMLNDSMLSTTFFSFQVVLVSSHPPFASDSLKNDRVESRWWVWLDTIENGRLELATSACACGSAD